MAEATERVRQGEAKLEAAKRGGDTWEIEAAREAMQPAVEQLRTAKGKLRDLEKNQLVRGEERSQTENPTEPERQAPEAEVAPKSAAEIVSAVEKPRIATGIELVPVKLSKLPEAQRRNAEAVIKAFRKNAGILKALGLERATVALPTDRVPTGSGLMVRRGELLIEPLSLQLQFDALSRRGMKSGRWAEQALVEEIIHLAQFKAAEIVGVDWRVQHAELLLQEKSRGEIALSANDLYPTDERAALVRPSETMEGDWRFHFVWWGGGGLTRVWGRAECRSAGKSHTSRRPSVMRGRSCHF